MHCLPRAHYTALLPMLLSLVFTVVVNLSNGNELCLGSTQRGACNEESFHGHETRFHLDSPSYCTFPSFGDVDRCGWKGIGEADCHAAGCCFSNNTCFAPTRPAQLEMVFYNKWMEYGMAVKKCLAMDMKLFCAKHNEDLQLVSQATCGPVWLDHSCMTCNEDTARKFLFCVREEWPSFVAPFPRHTDRTAELECASSGKDSEVNWFYM